MEFSLEKDTLKVEMNGQELTALGAAYREKLFRLTTQGESSEISDLDIVFSEAGEDDPGTRRLWKENLPDIIKTLQDFVSSTEEEVQALVRKTSAPNFRNPDIARRIALATEAGSMILELENGVDPDEILSDVMDPTRLIDEPTLEIAREEPTRGTIE